MKIDIILPVKQNSSRCINKNTRDFFNGKSLLDVKLETLSQLSFINRIILSSDSDLILNHAVNNYEKITPHKRESYYCIDSTPYKEVCTHLIGLVKTESFMWTHTTSPLITIESYEKSFLEFTNLDNLFDSLIGCEKIQRHLLNEDSQTINFSTIKHVYSQYLPKLYGINNSFFYCKKEIAINNSFNFGKHPKIYEVPDNQSIDIDTEIEFQIAQILYSRRVDS